MKYTVSRNGQALGTHSLDELRALVQSGVVLGTDTAVAEDAILGTTVAELTTPPVAAPVSAAPAVSVPPARAAAPAAAAAGPTFLVRRGNDQFGPYPVAQFLHYARAGNFAPGDIAWSAGMTGWEPVADVVARHGVTLPASPPPASSTDESLKWVLPVGRSGLAIAAGYLGLFSVLFLPAPVALVVGILAVRDLKKNPGKGGLGRAWFGIIMGAIFSAFLAFSILATLAR